MIPTFENICDRARAHLGDTDVAGGEKYTNTYLTPYFGTFWEEFYGKIAAIGGPKIKNRAYYNLAAYTTLLSPATAGISDFGELVAGGMVERDVNTTASVSTTDTGTPIKVTTTAPHGWATNQEVFGSGVVGQTGANGRFFITVVDPSNFTLNGSSSGGSYVSGGTFTASTDRFTPVDEVEDLGEQDPTDHLRIFEWRGDVFRFIGATVQRQLELTYTVSGNPVSTGSVAVDGCLSLAACRTAGLAADANDSPLAQILNTMAMGPNLNGDGGLMWDFLNPIIKAAQATPSSRRRFRVRRVTATGFGFPW